MHRAPLQVKDQIYFLHIPKTAGTSLFNILYEYFPGDDRTHYAPYMLVTHANEIARRQLIIGHLYYMVRHVLQQDPLVLTMLRNPINQVISHVRHLRRSNALDTDQDDGLLKFLRDPFFKPLFTNYQVNNIGIDVAPIRYIRHSGYFEGYEYWILRDPRKMPDDELVDIAKARLQNFAFTGITEHFDRSVELLTHTMHWETVLKSVHMNRDPEPLAGIPLEARQMIEEYTRYDRELYQFALNLFEQRYAQMAQELAPADDGIRDIVIDIQDHTVPMPPDNISYREPSGYAQAIRYRFNALRFAFLLRRFWIRNYLTTMRVKNARARLATAETDWAQGRIFPAIYGYMLVGLPAPDIWFTGVIYPGLSPRCKKALMRLSHQRRRLNHQFRNHLKRLSLWEDKWAGPHLIISNISPEAARVNILGFALLEHLVPPLILQVKVDGQKVDQIEVMETGNFKLQFPIDRPSKVEIIADQYFVPHEHSFNNDKRPLSWNAVEIMYE